MAGSDDSSLDLDLPWGRPSPKPPPGVSAEPGTEGQRVEAANAAETDDKVAAAPERAPQEQPDALKSVYLHVLEARLERLQREVAARVDRVEERALIRESALEARLDELEARIEASHAAIIDSVGMMAGQIVVRLEEDRADLEVGLRSRHEELVARMNTVRASMLAAIRDLALVVGVNVPNFERSHRSESTS